MRLFNFLLFASITLAQETTDLLAQISNLIATISIVPTTPATITPTPTTSDAAPTITSAPAIASSFLQGLESALKSGTYKISVDTSNILKYDPPPSSIAGMVLTAVPGSVLGQLIVPSERSSIASEFKAGKTPAWWSDLPPPVKSYVTGLVAQMSAGGGSTGLNGALITDAAATTKTSSALAAQNTGKNVAAAAAGVVGMLGFFL